MGNAKPASQVSYCLILLSAAQFAASLYLHQSRTPIVAGRYSLPFALALLAASSAVLFWAAWTVRSWPQWPVKLYAVITRVRRDALLVLSMLLGGALSWLIYYPPYGFVASTWFKLGAFTLLAGIAGYNIARATDSDAPDGWLEAAFAIAGSFVALPVVAYLPLKSTILPVVGLVGPVVLFVTATGASLIVPALISRFPSLWKTAQLPNVWVFVLAAAITSSTIAITYHEALRHSAMNSDERALIDFVGSRSIGDALFTPSRPNLFRPLFQWQAYFDHLVFETDRAGYVGVQLALLWLSSLVLFLVVRRVAGSGALAVLLAATTVALRPISDLVSFWAIDTMTLTATLATLAIYLTGCSPAMRFREAALMVVLLLACISRENGLVSVAGVALAGLIMLGQAHAARETKGQALRDLLVATLVGLAYFALRRLWLGQLTPSRYFIEDTCVGFDYYSVEEVARFSLSQQVLAFGYTSGSNLVAGLFPFVFDGSGCLQIGALGYWLLPIGAFGLYVSTRLVVKPEGAAPHHSSREQAVAAWLLPLGLIGLGPLLMWLAGSVDVRSLFQSVDLLIQGAISLLVLMVLLRTANSPGDNWIPFTTLGVLLGGSLLMGNYFRYRHFYVFMFCWAVLVGLCWRRLGSAPSRSRELQWVMVILLFALLLVNVIRINAALPLPLLAAD